MVILGVSSVKMIQWCAVSKKKETLLAGAAEKDSDDGPTSEAIVIIVRSFR
jgi:hypothetical protein